MLTYPNISPPCLKNIATKARGKAVRVMEPVGMGGEDYREEDKKRRNSES